MLKLRKCSKVPFPEQLNEGYEFDVDGITANVGADKIEAVMQHFIVMHKEEPLFFILELPAKADDEIQVEPGIVEALHKDVYYIDGCTGEEAFTILLRVGKLLFNDGISYFGYGGHDSGDEILFGKYNILTIISKHLQQYEPFFKFHNISKVDNLLTAYDTFSLEHPGESTRYTFRGKDVFSIPEQFKEWGMYLAEQREE